MKTNLKTFPKKCANCAIFAEATMWRDNCEAELREILRAYDVLEPEEDDIYKFVKEILGE